MLASIRYRNILPSIIESCEQDECEARLYRESLLLYTRTLVRYTPLILSAYLLGAIPLLVLALIIAAEAPTGEDESGEDESSPADSHPSEHGI